MTAGSLIRVLDEAGHGFVDEQSALSRVRVRSDDRMRGRTIVPSTATHMACHRVMLMYASPRLDRGGRNWY